MQKAKLSVDITSLGALINDCGAKVHKYDVSQPTGSQASNLGAFFVSMFWTTTHSVLPIISSILLT